MRALEEDHAAIKANCNEARVAHQEMASLLRQAADNHLDIQHGCSDEPSALDRLRWLIG